MCHTHAQPELRVPRRDSILFIQLHEFHLSILIRTMDLTLILYCLCLTLPLALSQDEPIVMFRLQNIQVKQSLSNNSFKRPLKYY